MATLLQIVCAEGERFTDPALESDSGVERARAAAEQLVVDLARLRRVRSCGPFARRCESLRRALQPFLTGVKSSSHSSASEMSLPVSEEFRWLRENVRLLHTALQDVTELSKLKRIPQVQITGGAAMPRVLAMAEAFFGALEFRFDAEAFAAFVDAVQEAEVLDLGEIWALPPCLKLVLLEEVASRAVQLFRNPAVYGVADCIRSLHHVGQTSWRNVLEPRILMDRVLQADPAGAYPAMDFEGRDRYWSAIAGIASHSDLSEMDVAMEALSLAQEAQRASENNDDDDADRNMAARRSHVGYYLIGEGVDRLQREVNFRPDLRRRAMLFLRRHPNACFLTGISLMTAAFIAAVLHWVVPPSSMTSGMFAVAVLALLLPCSQVAVELMNYLITSWMPVQILPKLDFSEGIPDDCATLVAVPVLLLNESQVRQLAEHLEILYLGNRDRNLHFALLTDLPDSREKPVEDDPLVALCVDLIGGLNAKYADQDRGSFLLLHRHRVYNPREQRWMGWERKRGKLMDLARLLRRGYDSFPVKAGNLPLLSQIRFLITLDADTDLPRGAAQRMVGTLAHPLNRAVLDSRKMVTSGFGVLQPRLGVNLQSAAHSRLANVLSGERGLDIYTSAVSDAYQDLYGEGIFTGKGIWDVDTLLQVLSRRFPENALLSHDLIEGVYARTGFVSDIELVDDFPSHYSAFSRRKHRWTRGDWQIAEWLLPRVREDGGRRVANPLSLVSRWKIFDNLRRSLVEPGIFVLLALAWLVLPGSPLFWTLAVIGLTFAPVWFHFAAALCRSAWKRSMAGARGSLAAFTTGNAAVLLRLAFLLHQTVLSLDAVARVAVRRLVTHRGLLEWETAAQAELDRGRQTVVDLYLDIVPVMAVALGIGIGFERLAALWSAGPILLLWACSKPVSQWLNQPQHTAPYEMSAKDLLFLRGIAVRTWRYFAEYGGEEHHWLIPDNLQHDPERVAARTSPTDIGLLLNVRLAACEMGYLTVPELAELTRRTLACLEELPKFRGHLFNWYSTQTLEPLAPRFVSSADSGNLAAALWALSEGCREYLRKPLLPARLLEGFIDHLRLAGGMPGRTWPLLPMCPAGPADWLPYMSEAVASVCNVDRDEIDHYVVQNEKDDCRWFAAEARRRYESVASTVRAYCPWMLPEFLSLRDALEIGHELNDKEVSPEQLPEFIGRLSKRLAWMQAENPNSAYGQLQSLLEDAYRNAIQLIGAMRRISVRARQLADEMDFNFLFNHRRKLLSVGFDAEARQLMPACYDLLASEARLAVFVAVAKEDIPQESWFLLGRSHVLNDGRPVLLSWTGTMFEYLMPSLWMNTYPDTLLARACTEAVRAQQSYAAGKHTPWGISESAHAKRHDTGSYQYSAFGVPPLALHPVDADLPVVSPYSTVLALPVDTAGALRNLRRMVKEGWFQAYGFCDAADYNVEHRSLHHGDCELVRCWMAHHQGMSMLALVNLLHGNVVQRWFHNNPQVQATERLLQEKPVGWVQRDVLRSRTAA